MIPSIRSLSELMAITKTRDIQRYNSRNPNLSISTVDSGKKKRYIRSPNKERVALPDLPKLIRRKWMHNKKYVSNFFDDLDYNNEIQSSYDLTLLERQNKENIQDVA